MTTPIDDTKSGTIGSDLLWGAEAIGREIKLPIKKVFYHLEKGNLPAKKIGGLWVMSRKAFQAHIGMKAE
ncbi:MAG TPA: hypothetical protein VMF05_05965 [Stellaceae bacterium]|nr:hypothetical protein [Stellaceae bacterium]